MPQIWAELLAQMSGFLADNLQKIRDIAISGPNTLVIRFPEGYNFIQDRCQERVGLIEQALHKVLGRPANVRIETIEPTSEVKSMDNSLGMSAVPGTRRADGAMPELPLIKKARDVLGAHVLSVDEGFGVGAAKKETESTAEKQQE